MTGPTGPIGLTGKTGITGITGMTGPAGPAGTPILGVVLDYIIARANTVMTIPPGTITSIGPLVVESQSGNAITYDGTVNFLINKSGLYQITYNIEFGPLEAPGLDDVSVWWQSTNLPARMGMGVSDRSLNYLNNVTTIQLFAGDSVSFAIEDNNQVVITGAPDATSPTRFSLARLVQNEDIVVRLNSNQSLTDGSNDVFANTFTELQDGELVQVSGVGLYKITIAGTYEINFNVDVQGTPTTNVMSAWFEFPQNSGTTYGESLSQTTSTRCNGVSCLRLYGSPAQFITNQPQAGQTAIGTAATTSLTRFSLVQYGGKGAQSLSHVNGSVTVEPTVPTLLVPTEDYVQGDVTYDQNGVFTINSGGIYRIMFAAVADNTGAGVGTYSTWWDAENVYPSATFGTSETQASVGSMNSATTIAMPSGAQIRFWALNITLQPTTWISPYFAIVQMA
jgi:hypothetical protein